MLNLGPSQIEDLQDGWHIAITVGPFDVDTLHSALTGPGGDVYTRKLWDKIDRQIKEQHTMHRMRATIDGLQEDTDATGA